jgi:hypothetical protein
MICAANASVSVVSQEPAVTVVVSVADDGEFHRLADERWAEFSGTGQTVPWDETKAWLVAKARGEHPARPAPRPFVR